MKNEFSHTPRKRFGQNFLQDPRIVQSIIASLYLQPEDNVIEIGPGLGVLTKPLLEHLNHLNVIEIDRDLVSQLKLTFNSNKLTIHNQDALTFDLQDFSNTLKLDKKFRLIGNLPYNISTPLIFHLLRFADSIKDMHFMLQKEVVDRLAALPNQKDYGRLSIMAQYYCKITPLLAVPANAFYPKPKVQSAFVRLTPHTTTPMQAIDLVLFQTIVRTAFSQRRKTLANALKAFLKAQDFTQLNINSTLRPETLSPAEFVKISNYVKQQSNENGKAP